MGFKFVPFQKPLECWAEPGHIFVREADAVIDCKTSLNETLRPQVNSFTSETAMFVLYDDTRTYMYVGNQYGTYQKIRLSDGVLMACGSWVKPYREWEPCGYVDAMGCLISKYDHRTIVLPHDGSIFRLHEPCYYWDMMHAEYYSQQADPGVPIILTERGLVNFERDGTWVPTRLAEGPNAPLLL